MGNNYIVTNWTNTIVTKSKQRHVCLKSDWITIGLVPPDWVFGEGIYVPDLLHKCHFISQIILMCLAQKCTLPNDLHVECHYLSCIYHLLHFGSSKMYVFVYVFSFKHFILYIHNYTFWFMPSFTSRLLSF